MLRIRLRNCGFSLGVGCGFSIPPLHLWPESVLLSDVGLGLATRVHLRARMTHEQIAEAEWRGCKNNFKVKGEALELLVCLQ